MPKVRFKRNFKYALDGVDVVTYPANTARDVPDAVARSAVRQGAAEMVQEGAATAKGGASKGTATNRSTGAQTKANQGASGGGRKVEEQGGT